MQALWPGLYVGEKMLLTVSFAASLPLILLLSVLLCARAILPRVKRVDAEGERRRGGGGVDEEGRGAGGGGVMPRRRLR